MTSLSSKAVRIAAALLASAALASCNGRGAFIDGAGQSTQSKKHTTLNIKIAGSGAQSKLHRLQEKRRKKYVSVATTGLAVYAYPHGQGPGSSPTAVADVSATSPYCTVNPDGSGDRLCAIPVTAPAGLDDFLVDGYDQPPVGGVPAGNLLEQGTAVGVTIVQGQPNTVNVTYDGQIASVAIVPVWMTSQNDGVTHSYSFTVNAYDADKYVIIDVTPFFNALSVTVANDPNKTLTVVPPAQGVDPRFYTLSYNGGIVNDGQLVASAAGVTATSTMDFTPLITIPNKLTVHISGPPQTFTAQLAVPAGVTPQSYQFFTATSPVQTACTVSPQYPNDLPWVDSNPVTFTVTAVAGNNCTIDAEGPETSTGFALNSIQVTIQP